MEPIKKYHYPSLRGGFLATRWEFIPYTGKRRYILVQEGVALMFGLLPFALGFGLGAFVSPRLYAPYPYPYAYPAAYAAYPYRRWY